MVVMKDEILPLSLLCHILGKITEMQRYEDFSILLLERKVTNIQDMDVNLLVYLRLFENYTFKKGRRPILASICSCLLKMLDYEDYKRSPLRGIIRIITKNFKKGI